MRYIFVLPIKCIYLNHLDAEVSKMSLYTCDIFEPQNH